MFFVFVIYVIKYPAESSKLYFVISDIKVQGEAEINDNHYKGSHKKFIVKLPELSETSIPTRNL